MTDDVIEQLTKVLPPSVLLKQHRTDLRDALLREFRSSRNTSVTSSGFSLFRFRKPAWRSVLLTSAVWLAVLTGLLFGYIVPDYQSDSVAARVMDTVMDSPEIRSLLGDDEAKTVSVVDLGSEELEVLVESHGGTIIIARVQVIDDAIHIVQISWVLLTGSIFQPDEIISGDELDRVIAAGTVNPVFRNLLDNGALVKKAVAVECLISTRDVDAQTTTDTRQVWAMVSLISQSETCHFLIDPENSRVISRGCWETP